jgi:hypothetical protein
VLSLVRGYVETQLAEQGSPHRLSDRIVAFDASNRLIDGVCYLFFCDDDDVPAIVGKAARTEIGKAIFDTEYDNLEALQAAGVNATRPAVPAPLGRWLDGETLITLQSALPGALMMNIRGSSLFDKAAVDESMDQVFGWWSHFQKCFGVRRTVLTDAAYETHVLRPIEVFRRRFVLDDEELEFLERRYERDRVLHGAELPLMARHGDFCTANMALGRGGIGVFDWEFPLDHRIPLFDLFFFIASVRFPFTGVMGESSHFESFLSVFWRESFFRAAVRDRLHQVCEIFGVPRARLADLLVLSLIDVANMKYDGLLQSHGAVDPPHGSPNEVKRAHWHAFERPDLDAPFACIHDGVFENLRLIVRRGLPEF